MITTKRAYEPAAHRRRAKRVRVGVVYDSRAGEIGNVAVLE